MNDEMKIFRPGSSVKMTKCSPPTNGVIDQVSLLSSGRIKYSIGYWDGRDRKVVDLLEDEFELGSFSDAMLIGFH